MPASSSEPDLSLVILSWNTLQLLRECLETLDAGAAGLSHEIIVIDNASGDGSADMVAAEFPDAVLVRNDHNRGYAPAVNQGLRKARGKKLCLLGSDTQVDPGALRTLAEFLDEHPEVGAVAPRLENPDGSLQRACMRFPSLTTVFFWDTPLQAFWPESPELRRYQMKDWDHVGTRSVDQPPGTCLMVPRRILDEVGLMDESLWLFFNDVDWALRIRSAGNAIWYLDGPKILHHLGGSTRHYGDFGAEWHRNRIRYYRKHHGFVGLFLTRAVLAYVALRQCVRMKKDIPRLKDWAAQSRQILQAMGRILTQR